MLGFSIRLWKVFRDIHTRGKHDPQCDYHILRLKRVQIAEPSVRTMPPIIPPPATPPRSPCMPDTASTSAPIQGRSRTRRPLPDLLVSRAILAWNLCSRLSLPDRGRSQSPSAPGGRVEVQRGTLPGARADRPQYFLFSGIAPLTPPRGSATSPAYRGMT